MNKKTSAKMQRWGLDQVEGERLLDIVFREAKLSPCMKLPQGTHRSTHQTGSRPEEIVTLSAICLNERLSYVMGAANIHTRGR